MSTIAGPRRLSITVRLGTLFADPIVRVAFAAGGLAAAVGGGLLLATSDRLVDPIEFGVQVAVMVVGWSSAALYWLVRRPGNRLGVFLLAVAVCTAVMSLQGATEPYVHSIGVSADWLFVVLVFYVILAFPEGRIASRVGWVLLGATALERLESHVPALLFSPIVQSNFPLGACNAACPANGFMIADRPTIAGGLFTSDMSTYYLFAVRSAIVVYLIYRLATATRPRRRALLPVYVPFLVALTPILVAYAARVELVHLDTGALSTLNWLGSIGISALPYGFLLSVVMSAFFAATALKAIVSRLLESPSAAQLRATLADALDDPSLELGFRLEQAGGFIDSSGKPLASTPAAGQSWSPVERNGETVAVIMHDAALDTDPELVRAASQATQLALENGRLESELRTTTTDLAASRARAVAAGDVARRKLERDLHDGAQQHLVGLSIELALARQLAKENPAVVARLDVVGNSLETALSELRDLAHGIHPPVLSDYGLQAALGTAARRCTPPAAVVADGIVRYPADIEAAVYFCCLEGLQNAGKHAGADAHIEVQLSGHRDELCFAVVDDGIGCDVESVRRSGAGLANIRERVAVLGGALTIDSAPGLGMQLRGRIPLGAESRVRSPGSLSGSSPQRG